MGLSTGSQIAAARKLLQIDQTTLAEKARVGIATIKRMERSADVLTVSGRSINKVKRALETLGVRLIDDHDELGVVISVKKQSAGRRR